MSRQSSAWMPLYIGDYLGDTQRLTTEQHGAYLLLILDYWRNGPAPDDDAVLQQITKLERAAWKKHRPALARLFQITDGEWRHKRIDKELAEAEANAERRSSKAKAAAQARWGDSPKDATGNAPSMPQALPVECPPQSPSPKSKVDANASTPELALVEEPEGDNLKPEHFVEAWNDLAGRLGRPRIRDLTPERRQKLKARINGHTIEDFQEVLGNIERSPFLAGDKGKFCTFDWVLGKGNFQKILEGNYNS